MLTMNGHIYEVHVKQQRIRRVDNSECGGWSYKRGGHVNGSFI